MKKITILAALVFVAAFGFGMTAEAQDDCDVGGAGNDVFSISPTSDGTNLVVTVVLCANALANVKYRLHIDHKDPNDLDTDAETNEPDTLIGENASCLTTSDDTMKRRGNKDTGPGVITGADNILIYTVSYVDLSLFAGDFVLLWVDTQYKGINDRAPTTEGGDGCSKPQVAGEVIEHQLS